MYRGYFGFVSVQWEEEVAAIFVQVEVHTVCFKRV